MCCLFQPLGNLSADCFTIDFAIGGKRNLADLDQMLRHLIIRQAGPRGVFDRGQVDRPGSYQRRRELPRCAG